jgi:hypothetical protein
MSVVKVISVKNSLAAQVRKPGGQTVGQSLDAAKLAINDLKGPTLSGVDQLIAEVDGLATERPDDAIDQIYARASNMLDLVGMFDEAALVEALTSLCDLTDHLREACASDWPSINVHVQSLKLIRHAGEDKPEVLAQILAGLRQVTDKAGR